jgi:hypothetical protein
MLSEPADRADSAIPCVWMTVPGSWYNDKLWFVKAGGGKYYLNAYSDADYSTVSSIELEEGDGFFFGISGITFTAGGNLCTVSGMVICYVEYFDPLLSYNVTGTLLQPYMPPMSEPLCLAADGTDLFIGYRSGWILKIPLSQLND